MGLSKPTAFDSMLKSSSMPGSATGSSSGTWRTCGVKDPGERPSPIVQRGRRAGSQRCQTQSLARAGVLVPSHPRAAAGRLHVILSQVPDRAANCTSSELSTRLGRSANGGLCAARRRRGSQLAVLDGRDGALAQLSIPARSAACIELQLTGTRTLRLCVRSTSLEDFSPEAKIFFRSRCRGRRRRSS
jgi:hypothetical protein